MTGWMMDGFKGSFISSQCPLIYVISVVWRALSLLVIYIMDECQHWICLQIGWHLIINEMNVKIGYLDNLEAIILLPIIRYV
jgi:hypothetical protein